MFAVLCMVAGLHGTSGAAPAREAAPASRLSEEGFVRIGGIDQWVTIHAADPRNPVILFLHGGPGDALSPYADSMFGAWENEFTLVQWDQRGAGRTFGRSGPSIESTITMGRMVQDGIEVAEYLTRRLGQSKVIVVGMSWGTMLGVHMVKQRPDLFHAYLGMGQLVNWKQGTAASYARLLELVRAAGDRPVIEALEAIGPPPWDTLRKWPTFRKPLNAYQQRRVTAAPAPWSVAPAYASPAERDQYAEADDFSFLHWMGITMAGPLQQIDLPALGLDFAIPFYIIQGEEDLVALPQLAKAYFDAVTAPRKRFVVVPGTGHEPSIDQLTLALRLLREEIRPPSLAK